MHLLCNKWINRVVRADNETEELKVEQFKLKPFPMIHQEYILPIILLLIIACDPFLTLAQMGSKIEHS